MAFPVPKVFLKPISWQARWPEHPTALWPPKSKVTYFDRQIFFAQGHHDLDRWENEAGFMAFHSCSHGILWKEKGKSE